MIVPLLVLGMVGSVGSVRLVSNQEHNHTLHKHTNSCIIPVLIKIVNLKSDINSLTTGTTTGTFTGRLH